MNGQPHTHEIQITGKNGETYVGDESAWITYGDTRVKLAHWWENVHAWPEDKKAARIERAARLAIARHDAGSLAAAERQAALDKQQEANRKLRATTKSALSTLNARVLETRHKGKGYPYEYTRERSDAWGSDLLGEEESARPQAVA